MLTGSVLRTQTMESCYMRSHDMPTFRMAFGHTQVRHVCRLLALPQDLRDNLDSRTSQ